MSDAVLPAPPARRVRLATAADAPALRDIYAPIVRDTATSFELEPPDAAEMARRLDKIMQRYPWLVCEEAGEVVGYAYGSEHRARPAYQWSVEVSVYVRPGQKRGGVGRLLYDALLRCLAAQGYYTAVAGITLPNEASVGFHRALGFAPVGTYPKLGYKLGAWHDTGWLARPLRPYADAPAPPRTLVELAASAEWPADLPRP